MLTQFQSWTFNCSFCRRRRAFIRRCFVSTIIAEKKCHERNVMATFLLSTNTTGHVLYRLLYWFCLMQYFVSEKLFLIAWISFFPQRILLFFYRKYLSYFAIKAVHANYFGHSSTRSFDDYLCDIFVILQRRALSFFVC